MRTVKVKLDADVAGFKAGVDSAKRSVDDLDDKVEALDRDLDKIPADALKAAAATKLLSGSVDDLTKNIYKIGDKATAISVMDTRIASARAEVKKLADEFVKTGDIDVFRKLGDAQSRLGSMQKIRKELAKALEDGSQDGAKTFAQLFQGGIISAFKSPQGIAAITAAAALLAVPVGAIVGGAILAGVATGGAALAGFAAVKADQQGRIAAAGADLLATVNKQVAGGGMSAIQPLLNGIRELKLQLADVHLDRMIATASQYIEPLANGAARFATYVAQAGQTLLEAGGPTVKMLADELPALGRAVKQFADSVAGGSEGGTRALQDFLRALESFIVTTGRIIGYLEKAYGAVRDFGDGFEHLLQKAHDANILLAGLVYPAQQLLAVFDTGQEKATGYAHRLSDVSQESAKLADQSKQTAEDVKSIDDAFSQMGKSIQGELTDKIISQMMAMDDATIAWHDSLNKLDDAVKKNGSSLDLNTDSGVRNQKAILAAVKANAELYQQNLLNKMSAEDAGKIYDKNAEQLRKAGIAAGYNGKELDGLIGKYKNVPERVQTILATIGLTDALNKLAQILIDFRNLNDKDFHTKYHVDTFYTTHYGSVGGKEGPGKYAQGGLRKAAAGMFIPPSDPGTVLTGEPQTGGEWLIPAQGIASSRARDLMRMAGSGYGLDVVPRGSGTTRIVVELQASGSGELYTLLQGAIRKGRFQVVAKKV